MEANSHQLKIRYDFVENCIGPYKVQILRIKVKTLRLRENLETKSQNILEKIQNYDIKT